MKTVSEIKTEKENKLTALMNECGVFFAFSTEQFHANKTPKGEDEKYVSLGAGGYCPKSKAQSFIDGLDNLDKWFKQAIKDNKARKEHIAYELANHEAYYTHSIEDTLEALGDDYTKEEVIAVFNSELRKHVAF